MRGRKQKTVDVLGEAQVSEGAVGAAEVKSRRKKKALIITLSCLLVFVILVTIVLSVLLNVKSLWVDAGNTDGAYGYVLADIDGITEANPRIVDIAMLGAHNANSFSISTSGEFDMNSDSDLLKKLNPVSSGLLYRMAVTQVDSPYTLLMQGVRFLHLKYTSYNGEWRATHGLIGREFSEDILEVLRYLDEHTGEVVVLLFQCTYFGDESYHTFHEWLATVEYNGKNLYDYVNYGAVDTFGFSSSDSYIDIESLTYNDVTSGGTASGVVMFDQRDESFAASAYTERSDYSAYFYDLYYNAKNSWHNRMGESELIEAIDECADDLLETNAYQYYLRINQTQASFAYSSVSGIFRSIGEWSLVKFAESYNAALLDNANFDKWLEAMPILQVDFANSAYGDFNNRVNAKIRARNEEIVSTLLEDGATYTDIYSY